MDPEHHLPKSKQMAYHMLQHGMDGDPPYKVKGGRDHDLGCMLDGSGGQQATRLELVGHSMLLERDDSIVSIPQLMSQLALDEEIFCTKFDGTPTPYAKRIML